MHSKSNNATNYYDYEAWSFAIVVVIVNRFEKITLRFNTKTQRNCMFDAYQNWCCHSFCLFKHLFHLFSPFVSLFICLNHTCVFLLSSYTSYFDIYCVSWTLLLVSISASIIGFILIAIFHGGGVTRSFSQHFQLFSEYFGVFANFRFLSDFSSLFWSH